MNLDEFRAVVRREFGERLERATPAAVNEFMAKMQQTLFSGIGTTRPLELNETASTWEQVVTEFFARVLDARPDQLEEALIILWLLGVQMHFARVEEDLARMFSPLLGEQEEEGR